MTKRVGTSSGDLSQVEAIEDAPGEAVETAVTYADLTFAPDLADEHDDAGRRAWLDVQVVNGVLCPAWGAGVGHGRNSYQFHNYGGLLTWVTIRNIGKMNAIFRVRRVDGGDPLTGSIEAGGVAYLGPFSPPAYNHVNQAVWLDVAGETAVTIHRLGVQ